jgi:hypothetical protein
MIRLFTTGGLDPDAGWPLYKGRLLKLYGSVARGGEAPTPYRKLQPAL